MTTKARLRKKRLDLEPTPDPEEHSGSHYTMTGFQMLVLSGNYFLLLIVLLLITTQIKKLMFLCHDRVKEFGLHRWGRGGGRSQ